jgi:hypothetical protein
MASLRGGGGIWDSPAPAQALAGKDCGSGAGLKLDSLMKIG